MKDVKKAIRYSCEDINSGNISGQGICVAVLDNGNVNGEFTMCAATYQTVAVLDTGECVIILQS